MIECKVWYRGKLHSGTTRLGDPAPAKGSILVKAVYLENKAYAERTVTLVLNTRTPKRRLPKRILVAVIKVPVGNVFSLFLNFIMSNGEFLEATKRKKDLMPCIVIASPL